MTAARVRERLPGTARPGRVRPPGAVLRLIRLHGVSRRVPAVLVVIAASAAGLRIALAGHWDTYGALQLPLMFETAAAAAVAVSAGSPFGEPERTTGRWLPSLRLITALALTAVAAAALAAAGGGAHLAGGTLDVVRNVAGLTGLGLLSAAALGGGLAWTGPTGYLLAGTYALYTQWHAPAMSTPWIWPARPPHDLGAALCAALVFAAGLLVTIRGARDPVGSAEY